MTLSAWDQEIIDGMHDHIARIEAVIEGRADSDMVRPVIGDAKMLTVAKWRAEIVKLEGWIENVKANPSN